MGLGNCNTVVRAEKSKGKGLRRHRVRVFTKMLDRSTSRHQWR